ncbi:hypothetical protein TIFTF001_016400 [Ficus carica]|uniref:Uncharacterized protein n=1 Tax=Ficus carica TaxID=3494 RepID=A0AA88D9V0_FICCA|nr:hypothetical protein TIFTF001_016400 [Ficus carica]
MIMAKQSTYGGRKTVKGRWCGAVVDDGGKGSGLLPGGAFLFFEFRSVVQLSCLKSCPLNKLLTTYQFVQ